MAGKGKKRMSIPGLVPGEEYVIQVRALDDGDPSTWSVKEKVTTIDDTAGGTRTPVTCVLSTWTLNAEGMFTATWPTVNANTDGTALHVDHYELQLSSSLGSKILGHYGTAEGIQTRDFALAQIKGMYGGQLPSSVTAELRVINSGGTAGGWSNAITAELPVPYPPTNPSGLPVVDGIKVMWQPPVEPYVPGDARWPAGYRVYQGSTEAFVPDGLQKSNMIYQGQSLEAAMTSMSYELDHWFKICSYSPADLQSEFITTGPLRPISPYGPDTTPPTVPQNLTATMNADRSVSGQANLAWTMAGDGLPPENVPEENKDITGFVVEWRLIGDERWRNTYFQKDARTGVIDLPRAFANYEFKIAAYDFVANYSDFSAVATLDGAGDPPLPLTTYPANKRWDGMEIGWDHSESQAVLNGGVYQVQFKASNDFTDDVPTHTTSNNRLDMSGLQPALSDWYWRVRPRDVMGRTAAWSAVRTETLPAFPSAATSDDLVPASAPQNVKANGGLNYINVSWDRVINNDPVWYNVYMSTTSGFTPSAATFAGLTSATSIMINNLPAAPNAIPLVQGTTYYVKVIAEDTDGPSLQVSAQDSAELTQIAGGDLGINMSGENLLYNTSFEVDSDINGLADYWAVYNNSSGTEPATATTPATGRTGGKCQRITWTGVNTTQKGILPVNQQGLVRPNTEYTVSFYARASAGTGFNLTFNANVLVSGPTPLFDPMPTPSTTVWQRYAFKFTSSATPEPNNFHITIVGNSQNGGWVEFDDIQMEAGNVASAYKFGTVSIAKLASGTMKTAIMTIATGGEIRSEDYNFANKTGFLITGTGINLMGGTVNAAILQANSTITNKLYVGADLEISASGKFFSTNYRPAGTNGASDAGAGFRMDSAGIDIRSGTVAAGALSAGTVTAGGIKIGAGGEIVVDSTGAIRSNVYSSGSTGWKISSTGIEMWDTNSKINVAALETGTLGAAVITIGSGGEFKSANWHATNKTGYRLTESGFTLHNGTIEGSTIRTNQIYSLTNDATSGKPTFSINAQGYAELAGALVHGNMRVSDGASNVIQSAAWSTNGTGWQIRGDGWAQFTHVNTWNLNVYSSAKVGGDWTHSISSVNHSYGVSGWIIRGDGYAEFNGGMLIVGNYDGGKARLMYDGNGNGQLRFNSPGREDSFHHLRANGTMFEMRGGWGGAIEIYPNGGAGGEVRLLNNARVTQHLTVDNQLHVGGSSVHWGETQFMYVPGPVGQMVAVGVNGNGYFKRMTSSKRYKENIKPLELDYRKALELEPKTFMYDGDVEEGLVTPGFIAEEVHDLGLTEWVAYADVDGEWVPDAFHYGNWTAALQHIAREQQKQIDLLTSRLEKLERGS